jgi:ethanolamine utilization protein EutK
MNNANGFLEVKGLVCGIEAADAMLKAASVRLVTQITTKPGLITLVVEGDIGSCRAAVDAGRMAAERLGGMVSEKVIGRPEPDLTLFLNPPRKRK